jgi:hypothetical protein
MRSRAGDAIRNAGEILDARLRRAFVGVQNDKSKERRNEECAVSRMTVILGCRVLLTEGILQPIEGKKIQSASE